MIITFRIDRPFTEYGTPEDPEVEFKRLAQMCANILFCMSDEMNRGVRGDNTTSWSVETAEEKRTRDSRPPDRYHLGEGNNYWLNREGPRTYRISARYPQEGVLMHVYSIVEWKYGHERISLVGESELEKLARLGKSKARFSTQKEIP